MPAAPSPIRDILQAIGLAIAREMVRLLNEKGRFPLRKNSPLAQSILDGVSVDQARTATGQFAGYTANSALSLVALEYAQWVDTGRAPGVKKIPLDALLDFIRNRGLHGRNKKTGQFITANQLGFMIQNAIFKNGIRGRHFIQPAFDLGQNLIDIYLDNQLLDGVTYELDRQLKFR